MMQQHATFVCRKMEPAFIALTCRETGDRFTAVRAGGEWLGYINECRQVYRSSRADILEWMEAEAAWGLAVTRLP